MNCPHCHKAITLALVAAGEAAAHSPAPSAAPGPLAKCPLHQTAWTYKQAGVSKAGKPFSGFWKCDGKNADGSYCSERPAKAFVQATPPPAPATKLDELDELDY